MITQKNAFQACHIRFDWVFVQIHFLCIWIISVLLEYVCLFGVFNYFIWVLKFKNETNDDNKHSKNSWDANHFSWFQDQTCKIYSSANPDPEVGRIFLSVENRFSIKFYLQLEVLVRKSVGNEHVTLSTYFQTYQWDVKRKYV